MRLHKFLAHAGVASRRKAEVLIKRGKVTVNDLPVGSEGTMVNPERDIVKVAGKKVSLTSNYTYIALHKPAGYISSTSSIDGKTVLKLIKSKTRLYPVGRLDKYSSGLLILTNDGDFANKLTHPRYESEKEYFITLDQELKPEDIKKLEKGMMVAGKKVRGIKVLSSQNKSARVILKEGVNRQIRRMFGKLGYTVTRLKRVRIGKLELGELKEGQWRKIDKKDV